MNRPLLTPCSYDSVSCEIDALFQEISADIELGGGRSPSTDKCVCVTVHYVTSSFFFFEFNYFMIRTPAAGIFLVVDAIGHFCEVVLVSPVVLGGLWLPWEVVVAPA